MQRGKEEESGIYRDFYNAVIEAENYAETKAVRAILKTGEKDAKYLQWWLERKFPERWGRVNDTLRALHDELKALKARIDAQA